MNRANNGKMPSDNITEDTRIPIPNRRFFNSEFDTSGFSIDYLTNRAIRINQVIDRSLTICPFDEANAIRSANIKADEMEEMSVDELSAYLSEKRLGGGKKKKGGSLTLFLPLAILLAKDTNKAIQAMSNLGIDYIYSWFDYMNKLEGCYKYIYDKAMYDIYPYLVEMYDKGHVKEVAPFIINNVPIYFNYVIQKLSDVEETITDKIAKSKAEELKTQYQEMKSRFEKGKDEDQTITNEIIEERLRYAGILKTETDRQERKDQKIVDQEQKLADVEKLIAELEKKKLENTQATINAVLKAKQNQRAQKILQTETRELGEMLLEDPIFQQAKRKPTEKSLNPDTARQKRIEEATQSRKIARQKNINELRGITPKNGGKRNTKKHYNKKKKTKKHAKKLHRKTKRG